MVGMGRGLKRRRPEVRKRIWKRVAVGRDGARDFLERFQVMEVGVLGLRVFVEGEVRLAVIVDKWSAVIFPPACLIKMRSKKG